MWSVTVPLVCTIVLLSCSQLVSAQTSPWGYRCDTGKGTCIKEEITEGSTLVSLARCKLTCSPEGVLWPKPTSVSLTDNVVEFLPDDITQSITAPPEVEPILDEAIIIFKNNIQKRNGIAENERPHWKRTNNIETNAHTLLLDITVAGDETRLKLTTNESYSLSLSTEGELSTALIFAPTYFGARHALETLSQLMDYEEDSDNLMLVSEATITDSPVFPYRGIALDTSRNFISVKAIERTLDAMSANKLNTLHWHITDSQSFPLQLEQLPKMSYYGAYSPTQIYTRADVLHLVEYGRNRGIRVMPEFDSPGHVGNGFQWGPKDDLGDLAVCINQEPWAAYCVEPPCGQMNLANPNMYVVLGQIYKEMVEIFSPIDLFHFGGDEVNLNCWNSTDEIVNWMLDSGFGLSSDAYFDQWGVFQEKALQLLTEANMGEKVPGILWTSHLTDAGRVEQYVPNTDYIIQIWTTGDDPIIGELLNKNYRLIFSNYDHSYLDCGFGAWIGEGNNWCSPYKGWQTVYDNNPIKIAEEFTTTFDPSLILGGETALWTEQTDDTALDSRLWPRGAALGERLWANPDHNWRPAETRLINHRQRMVQRGIQADRIQPQWCHQNEGLCNA